MSVLARRLSEVGFLSRCPEPQTLRGDFIFFGWYMNCPSDVWIGWILLLLYNMYELHKNFAIKAAVTVLDGLFWVSLGIKA